MNCIICGKETPHAYGGPNINGVYCRTCAGLLSNQEKPATFCKHFKINDIFNQPAVSRDDASYTITQKIVATCQDLTDKAIVAACIECAKAEGVTDLYLLDRRFVLDALKEKMEREKEAQT